MNTTTRRSDPEYMADLLERQQALQSQAQAVIASLDLITLFTPLGRPVLVGSVVTGLMVWPDIDIVVPCASLDPDRLWDTVRPLASHPRIRQLRWSNVRGRFNSTGRPEIDGYYVCIHYEEGDITAEEVWRIDCWFVPLDAPRPEFALMDRLQQELTEETRLAVLSIKDVWCRHPDYLSHKVCSTDIYNAVLDANIRSPDEFATWLRERTMR